jgi:hypothetical protein
MANVATLLNDDDLWAQYVKLYGTSPQAIVQQVLKSRNHYRVLVNQVEAGLASNPPKYRPGNNDPNTAQNAYVTEKGGKIYLQKAFFDQLSDKERQNTLIHEYGRVYLWDNLPNDTGLNPADKKDVSNWDAAVLALSSAYERVTKTK